MTGWYPRRQHPSPRRKKRRRNLSARERRGGENFSVGYCRNPNKYVLRLSRPDGVAPEEEAVQTVASKTVIDPETVTVARSREDNAPVTAATGRTFAIETGKYQLGWREKLKKDPTDVASLIGLGGMAFEAGQYPRAASFLQRAARMTEELQQTQRRLHTAEADAATRSACNVCRP